MPRRTSVNITDPRSDAARVSARIAFVLMAIAAARRGLLAQPRAGRLFAVERQARRLGSRGDRQVCWIADKIHLPPRLRRKVQTSPASVRPRPLPPPIRPPG